MYWLLVATLAATPTIESAKVIQHGPWPGNTWQIVPITSTDCSSALPKSKSTGYGSLQAVDNDLTTAWIEGSQGDGSGEWLRINVMMDSPKRSLAIKIAPGYQKSKDLFHKNCAPTAMTLRFKTREGVVVSQQVKLSKQMGYNVVFINWNEPTRVESVTLLLDQVRKGTRWNDAGISEVSILQPGEPSLPGKPVSQPIHINKELLEQPDWTPALADDRCTLGKGVTCLRQILRQRSQYQEQTLRSLDSWDGNAVLTAVPEVPDEDADKIPSILGFLHRIKCSETTKSQVSTGHPLSYGDWKARPGKQEPIRMPFDSQSVTEHHELLTINTEFVENLTLSCESATRVYQPGAEQNFLVFRQRERGKSTESHTIDVSNQWVFTFDRSGILIWAAHGYWGHTTDLSASGDHDTHNEDDCNCGVPANVEIAGTHLVQLNWKSRELVSIEEEQIDVSGSSVEIIRRRYGQMLQGATRVKP